MLGIAMFYFELIVFILGCIPILMSLWCLIMWLYIKFAKFIIKHANAELPSIPDEEKSDSFVSDADYSGTSTDIYDPEKDEKAKEELYQSLFAIILGLVIGIPLGIYLFS